MAETFDEQLLMHDAAALCGLALLRPAAFDEGEPLPIIGTELDRDGLLGRLEPALNLAWPDRAREATDLESFLREAYRRFVSRAEGLSGADGFVPAARWGDQARGIFLEHLHVEIEALICGVRTEGFWQSFNAVDELALLEELVSAGMLIKLRSVGAFLVQPPSQYQDELTAAAFFAAGAWEEARDAELAAHIASYHKRVHKEIAHLTVTRPLPHKIGVHRPSSYLQLVLDILALFEQFTAAVDPRLLPDWWQDWSAGLRSHLLA